MVAEVNQAAIEKSDPLKQLKNHLDTLNHSLNCDGQTELTPFPKRIRDLSKDSVCIMEARPITHFLWNIMEWGREVGHQC